MLGYNNNINNITFQFQLKTNFLGQKFGILQIKIGVAYIIKNFEVFVNKKTMQPLKYDPVYWLTTAQGGLWLDFKSIT